MRSSVSSACSRVDFEPVRWSLFSSARKANLFLSVVTIDENGGGPGRKSRQSQDSASARRQHGVSSVAVALEDDNGAIAYRKSAAQQFWYLVGERRGQGDCRSGHSVTDSDGW